MKSKTKITYGIAVILFVLLLLFITLFGGSTVSRAETSDGIAFDSTYVMDDLKGSTVDGKAFNLFDYGFDKNKPTKIFSFVEYCYSFTATNQDNYGLYVYVYNPQGIKFVYNSVQNKIQFAVGESAPSYEKYSLQYLNCSVESNFEGLFIKYKVVMSEARKKAILDALNSTERVYQISGIELLIEGELNAHDYPATGVVDERSKGTLICRYSGYSKGYGANSDANTLSMTCSEGDVLSLEVHHTSYRPEGTHADDMYTQDSINSVYFAVPKEFSDKYGYLSEVHAEWRDALTSWGLVTGNEEIYNKLYEFVGQNIGHNNRSVGYVLRAIPDTYNVPVVDLIESYPLAKWSKISYNSLYIPENVQGVKCDTWLTQLNWLFSAGNGLNVADHTIVSSDTIYDWYSSEFTKIVGAGYGETLACKDGKTVYKALFDSVDDEIKDYHLSNDGELITLVSQKWTQSWWQKHVSGGHSADKNSQPITGIEVIHEVVDADILSNETEMSNRLYISTSDCSAFKKFYADNKAENNIYLLRFKKTDYTSYEATEYDFEKTPIESIEYEDPLDTNAYFFKQAVFLDFDIIDVTFDNGKVKTVIPVVSDPIDIFPEATPPVFVTEDKDPTPLWKKILKIVLGVILGIVVVCILLRVLSIISPIFKPLWNLVVSVFTAPIRFVKWLCRKRE